MKPVLSIFGVLVLCVVGLVIIRKSHSVSAEIVSCAVDQKNAKVSMRYRNRSTEPVTLGYHLVVMRATSTSRSGRGDAEQVASRRISGVVLAAGESRDDVVAIAVPEKLLLANVVVD